MGLGTKKLHTFVSHFLNFRMSPSHTVGLEQVELVGNILLPSKHVSIPHGGLRTCSHESSSVLLESVAIPHGGLRTSSFPPYSLSGVGVAIPHGGLRTRHHKCGRNLQLPLRSPSHTVGLELPGGDSWPPPVLVAIPHGGLRTLPCPVRDLSLLCRHPTRWA